MGAHPGSFALLQVNFFRLFYYLQVIIEIQCLFSYVMTVQISKVVPSYPPYLISKPPYIDCYYKSQCASSIIYAPNGHQKSSHNTISSLTRFPGSATDAKFELYIRAKINFHCMSILSGAFIPQQFV